MDIFQEDGLEETIKEAMQLLAKGERVAPSHRAHKILGRLKLEGAKIKGSPMAKLDCRNEIKSLFMLRFVGSNISATRSGFGTVVQLAGDATKLPGWRGFESLCDRTWTLATKEAA